MQFCDKGYQRLLLYCKIKYRLGENDSTNNKNDIRVDLFFDQNDWLLIHFRCRSLFVF